MGTHEMIDREIELENEIARLQEELDVLFWDDSNTHKGYENPYHALASRILHLAIIDWWKTCAPDRKKAQMMIDFHCSIPTRNNKIEGIAPIHNFADEFGFKSTRQEMFEFFSSEWCQTLFDLVDVDYDASMEAIGFHWA